MRLDLNPTYRAAGVQELQPPAEPGKAGRLQKELKLISHCTDYLRIGQLSASVRNHPRLRRVRPPERQLFLYQLQMVFIMRNKISSPPQQLTALIVDDDKSQQLLMRSAMQHAGLHVLEAGNGNKALQLFLECRPDIILMDVNMPVMDGFTACREIRKTPAGKSVPIIMATGSDDYDSIARAYEAGATDFVQKPVNLLLLSHRVKYMLRAHRAIDELSVSEAKLEKAYRISKLCSWSWSPTSDTFLLSKELFQIALLAQEDFGGSYAAFLETVHPEDRERVDREMQSALASLQSIDIEYRVTAENHSEAVVRLEGSFQGSSNFPMAAGTIQDVTLRIQTERQIRILAYYDRLTGLPNSFLFKELLESAITNMNRNGGILAVMFVDIENFRRVNDTFGRGAGDEILQTIARRITNSFREPEVTACFRGDPTCARLAADQFAVILVDLVDSTNAAVVARRIQKAISEAIQVEQKLLYLNSRIGISLSPSDGSHAETLMKNADIALTRVKESVKSTYHFYTSDLNAKAFVRFSLEMDLRTALEKEELFCVYQPQLDLATGEVVGVEALLRWNHPEKGLIPPPQIIEIAEATGLIIPIGKFVLRTACRQNMLWQKAGYQRIRMAVNLSVAQLNDKNLLRMVESTLAETGHPAELLELEITESMLLDNVDGGIRIMKSLGEMGVHLSIDDFGTGYSSLNYLKRFPVRALKIDRSFVAGTPHDSDGNVIVTAIVNLAHNLGLKLVAEGVETEEQMDFLKHLGCDTIQGYLVSRPVLPEGILKFLRRSPRRMGVEVTRSGEASTAQEMAVEGACADGEEHGEIAFAS
jgi:diguanylate cyclase (GGDEF)-like protein